MLHPFVLYKMASSELDALLKAIAIEDVILLNKQLGQGAYGRVFTVKYRGEVYAAKEIHPILIEKAPPVEKKTIVHNFIKECHQCSLMQHPNIVRFFGVYYSSRNSDLPIMVMELMNESLTSFVKNNQSKIPVTSKLSILYDVSLGLNYLHTNTPVIIHRDLSPNNVMLTSELVAKIGDLGVAKVVHWQADSRQTRIRLTMAPGTEDFMPPETFEDNPVYSTAVDVFSFAGIALHVFAEEWPRPGGQKRRDPVTRKLVPVTEAERRQEYFDKIPKGVDNLKQLLEQCLDDVPEGRPPVQEISNLIDKLKVII